VFDVGGGQIGPFSLHMKRAVGKTAAVASPIAQPVPPVPSKPMLESIPTSSIPSTPKPTALSAAIVKPVSNFGLLEAAADAGLLFVTSPKVGYFRKGRVVKGKKGPPLCEEGQIINKGQVVCYLEQLGTQQPVESDITGEVEKVLWKDGEPVGYGDPLIAIRPSFQGIKIKKFNE
jgi:biotin carboxyl carrier protein